MAAATYYGLLESSGNIIKKGWTTLPTLKLFGRNLNSGQWYHCYCDTGTGLRSADTLYSSGLGGPAWGNLPKGSSITMYSSTGKTTYTYYSITRNIAGYSQPLTQNLNVGSVVYDQKTATSYTICQYTVKDKFTVTVKKCLDNGTQTQVSQQTVEDGDTITVPIPAAYSNSVLSGVLIDSGSQSYKSGGYPITVTANTTVLFKFTSTVKITLAKGTGGNTISGSATTSFTRVTTSANAGGSFNVEKGTTISLSATAASGYVLHTNAISPSTTSYASISGNGGSSASGTQTATVAATFTVNGIQYTISPSLANSAWSSWGTPKIKEHSASSWSTTALVLKPNTTYDLGFDSKTASTLAAAVDYWSIAGATYSTTFTTGSTITSGITAYLYLVQTKWQLTVSASMADSRWGSTSGGGWYAANERVTVTFSPSSSYASIAPTTYQINYNGSTVSCGNSTTITTTNASLEATFYVRQTKFRIDLAFGTEGTSSWGSIKYRRHGDTAWSDSGVYIGSNESIDVKFTPNSTYIPTIHPKVNHWLLIDKTVTPTSQDDGSSEATITIGTINQGAVAYCYLESSWRKVTVRRSDSFPANWGDFDLVESGATYKERYFAPGSKIKIQCTYSSTLILKERPQVNYLTVGTEDTIFGTDGTFEYEYTLPANVKTDLVIDCYVKQTAWPVTVKVNSGEIASLLAKRIDIASGTVIASVTNSGTDQTIYLRSGATAEYLSLEATPKEHYSFSAWEKTNLSNYGGDATKVQLTTAAAATVKASGVRSDFKITATSDNATVSDVYMQDVASSTAYYPKNVAQNPVVVCKIKSDYADQYKVKSFKVGDQDNIEAQYNPAANIYYVEVAGRSDVTVVAHVVKTRFRLTVDVAPANKTDFGTVIISVDGQEKAENAFANDVKEGSRVSIVFYQKYGGRVLQIQPTPEIASPVITDNSIEFDMPSAECGVNFTLGAKEKYALTFGVVNLASGEAANIPGIVTVRSRTYPDVVIGATAADGVAKTFQVYKGEEYSLTVTPVSDYLSRRYAFVGWRDASAAIPGAVETTLNVLNTTEDALVRYASYNSRANGTITIEWAKKVNETITPITQPEGCSLEILNTQDKYDETHWLVGPDITIPYEVKGIAYDEDGDAYKWTPVEVDVEISPDPYGTPNAVWDDGLLTQNGSFKMLGNMKVRVVLTQTHVPGFTTMHVGFHEASHARMGEVSIFSTEMDAYTTDSTGATVLVQKTKKAVIMAAPRPGYAFAGWFTLVEGVWNYVEGAKAVYEIAYITSPMTVYYAMFVASTLSNVKMWNGNNAVAKTCEWQSKVYVGAQYFDMNACRVYADAYPVTLKVMMSSSPDGIFGENARTVEIPIRNQDPRRLPMIRPEKYFAFKVTGYARINHVGIASSMEALK